MHVDSLPGSAGWESRHSCHPGVGRAVVTSEARQAGALPKPARDN